MALAPPEKKVLVSWILIACIAIGLTLFLDLRPEPPYITSESCKVMPRPPEDKSWECFISHYNLDEVEAKAAAGDADMQIVLGDAYHYGEVVKADDTEAMKWYRKAADSIGLKDWEAKEATIRIAHLYETGTRNIRDYQEASKWYQRAAERDGTSDSYLFLAHLYEKGGPGLLQDYAEAYFWYSLAILAPYSNTEKYLKERAAVAPTLSFEQRTSIDKRVGEWLKAHPATAAAKH